ncbi:ferredoxin:glutaredoxin reductase [candidate division WOR-3 bacterium]|nr:ferredoxin:glutaredoxin reductase [candidate division WOR-3 bacterium]
MANERKQQKRIDVEYERLDSEAEAGGYHLNPDIEFTKELIEGLLVNEERYGYSSCPCRLASGDKTIDLDIICPCDYRDADVVEYDACYCGLYVSRSVIEGRKKVSKIPERRPPVQARVEPAVTTKTKSQPLPYPIWRCRVCGYLCARNSPPEECPVCRARKERFEMFIRNAP